MALRRRFGAFTAATLLAAFALSPAVSLAAEPTDTNLALISTVSASGTENDSQFTPDRAADGHVMPEGGTTPAVHNNSQASRWSAPKDDGPWWIQLEFPASAHLSRVAVHWGNTYATSYRLEVSDNGTDFTPIVENAAATAKGEVVNHDVDTTTRFLRLYATQKSAKWSMSLWELEAFGTLTATPPAHDATSIIPKPYSAQITNGETFKLSATTCVSGNKSTMGAQQVLQNHLGIASGTDCAIKLAVNPQAELFDAYERQHLQANEGYQLTISSDEVTITGASPRAVVWGVQSLIQLAGPWASVQLAGTVDSTDSAATPAAATVAANATESTPTNITDYKAQTIELPTLQIKDAPRYKWRGLLLDPARSFIAVDDVLGFIDEMSALKLNTLHFHLSDDQGWRIAISQPEGSDIDYTKLTEISGATAFGASKWADVAGDTGYYTRDDFAKIVRYAASRGVSVVPEIDGPGHTQAALHAIDQLNTADAYPHPAEGETRVPADIGQGDMTSTLDPRSDATYEFLHHVYTDVMKQVRDAVASSLDPSLALNYFHLGGDESKTTTGADYQEFMRRTTTMITDESLTPIVWNEAMKESFDTLPANTVVQYWNQSKVRFAEHAARGGSFIMSPASNTYFPQIPSTDVAGPNWACGGGACDLQRWYNWDPTQSAGVPEASMQGVEGALWNEHMRDNRNGSDNMSFLIFPRALALSEVGWTQQSNRSWDDFAGRLATAGTALNVRGRTFHLAQEAGFAGSYLPLAARGEISRKSDATVRIGLLSLPGSENTQGLPSVGDLQDAQGEHHEIALSYRMTKPFHYTDEGRMTGRRMNSTIEVQAHIPASLALPTGAASIRLSGSVAASGRRVPFTFGENAVSTLTLAAPAAPEEPEPTVSAAGLDPEVVGDAYSGSLPEAVTTASKQINLTHQNGKYCAAAPATATVNDERGSWKFTGWKPECYTDAQAATYRVPNTRAIKLPFTAQWRFTAATVEPEPTVSAAGLDPEVVGDAYSGSLPEAVTTASKQINLTHQNGRYCAAAPATAAVNDERGSWKFIGWKPECYTDAQAATYRVPNTRAIKLPFTAQWRFTAAPVEPEPPAQPTLTVASGVTSVPQGGEVSLIARGFQTGHTVRFELHSTPVTLGTAPADSEGTAVLTTRIPNDTPAGEHTIIAIDTSEETVRASQPITVTQAAVQPEPGEGEETGEETDGTKEEPKPGEGENPSEGDNGQNPTPSEGEGESQPDGKEEEPQEKESNDDSGKESKKTHGKSALQTNPLASTGATICAITLLVVLCAAFGAVIFWQRKRQRKGEFHY